MLWRCCTKKFSRKALQFSLLALLFRLSRPYSFIFLIFQALCVCTAYGSFIPTRSNPIAVYMAYMQAVEVYAMTFIANDGIDSHLFCLCLMQLYKGQLDAVLFTQTQTYLQALFSSYSLCMHPSVCLMNFYWKKSH